MAYFSRNNSRLHRIRQRPPKNRWGLLMRYFYRPDVLPVTQPTVSNQITKKNLHSAICWQEHCKTATNRATLYLADCQNHHDSEEVSLYSTVDLTEHKSRKTARRSATANRSHVSIRGRPCKNFLCI